MESLLKQDDWLDALIDKADAVVMNFSDGKWYKSEGNLGKATCSETNDDGLMVRYDDGDRVVHTEFDMQTYNQKWWLLECHME